MHMLAINHVMMAALHHGQALMGVNCRMKLQEDPGPWTRACTHPPPCSARSIFITTNSGALDESRPTQHLAG